MVCFVSTWHVIHVARESAAEPVWIAAARYSATPLCFRFAGKSGVAEYLAAAVQITSFSNNALAKALNVPAPRINDIVRERPGVSADTAMRLARYFGGDARSWLNLQAAYDLRVAEIASAKRIEREIAPATA